ncbi:MAG TPA: hypothetical protein VFI03_09225 [Solirubrobacterales bacterium]|nr:hypothetical protein [Solirubrobacterales bacterium]
MSQEQKPNPDFEQRLLARLKAVVAERGAAATEAAEAQVASPSWRRRGPRLALGAAVALGAIVVALIVSAGGDNTSQAFAVEPREGGGVTIKVYSLEDASGLEQALEEAGIKAQVTWLAAGMVCREPHYKESIVHLPGGGTFGSTAIEGPGGPMTIGVGSTQRWRESFGKYTRGEISQDEMLNSVAKVNLDPKAFGPDQSVVLSGTPVPYDGDPEGGSIAKMGVAKGPVEPCEPVPALPSGFGGGLSAGGGSGYAPRGDKALSQAAVAADLRQAANSAEASETQVATPPGPGQFLYTRTKVVQLQGWEPEGRGAGTKANPRYFTTNLLGSESNALAALVPTTKEVWMAPDGTTRERETLGRVEFLSGADQRLWEEAGSPPPFAYDPTEHDVGHDSSGRPLKEFSSKAFRGRREFSYLSRLSRLPTEPEALRLEIENRRGGSAPVDPSPADSERGGATVERLLEILSEPITSPAFRAAAFNALAEIPGIGFERDVADVAGRKGDAISWVRDRGFGRRYIFDPSTSEILAEAEMIFNSKAAGYPGVPNHTAFRETAYLRSAIVDSIDGRPGGRSGGPVATP